MKEQRLSSPKSGKSRADSRKECFILEIMRLEAASAEMTWMPGNRVNAALGGGFWKGQRRPDQEERTRLAGASKAPAGAPSTSGSLLQNRGQHALEGKPID